MTKLLSRILSMILVFAMLFTSSSFTMISTFAEDYADEQAELSAPEAAAEEEAAAAVEQPAEIQPTEIQPAEEEPEAPAEGEDAYVDQSAESEASDVKEIPEVVSAGEEIPAEDEPAPAAETEETEPVPVELVEQEVELWTEEDVRIVVSGLMPEGAALAADPVTVNGGLLLADGQVVKAENAVHAYRLNNDEYSEYNAFENENGRLTVEVSSDALTAMMDEGIYPIIWIVGGSYANAERADYSVLEDNTYYSDGSNAWTVRFQIPARAVSIIIAEPKAEEKADETAPEADESAEAEGPVEADEILLPKKSILAADGIGSDTITLTAVSVNSKGGNYNLKKTGEYTTVQVTGTYNGNQAPTTAAGSAEGSDTQQVLEAWLIGNVKNNTSLFLTAVLRNAPALLEDESLAFYTIQGGKIDELLADGLAVGDTATTRITFKGVEGVALVKITPPDEEENVIPDNAIWANDDIYLTGKMPGNAVVDAVPVNASVDGEEVLAAYDIKIYANEKQRVKGKTWQPAGDKVQVHFRDDAFAGVNKVGVYHITDSAAELVGTYRTDGEWLTFDASSFSVYAVTSVIEKTIEASDGHTYKISVAYDEAAGIPADAELQVSEVEDLDKLALAAASVNSDLDSVSYGKLFDISIVKDDTAYQPNDSVTVTVELLDASALSDVKVIHFGTEPEALTAATDGNTVTFETEGFSLFSFLDFSVFDRIVEAVLGQTEGVLFENDDIILSGKMPSTAVVEARRVDLEDEDVLVAYDIKIYAHPVLQALGISWQPTDGAIQVTVKSDALDVQTADVYHLTDAGSEAELVAEDLSVNENAVVFEASTFSIYAVSSQARKTFEFYQDDQSTPYSFKLDDSQTDTTYKQRIKNGEKLIMPQLPEKEGMTFLGWYVFDSTDPETPAGSKQSFDEVITVTSDQTIKLYAKFGYAALVSFHAAQESGGVWPIAYTRFAELESGSQATVSISDITVSPVSDLDVFVGWTDTSAHALSDDRVNYVLGTYNGHTYTGGALNAATSGDTTTITVATNSVDLYPVFAAAKWIHYSSGETGNGSDYQAPQYVLQGSTVNKLPVVGRTGYTFAGWYDASDPNDHLNGTGTQVTDADGNIRPNLHITGADSDASGNMALNGDVSLYARWIPNGDTPYHVVYWVQQASDDVGLSDAEKHYDYVSMVQRTGATGATASLTAADRSVRNVGADATGDMYEFNGVLSTLSTEIAANGSTVMNVYFDRKPITLNFQVQQSNTWSTVYTITELYGHNISRSFKEAPFTTTYLGYVWSDVNKAVFSEILSTIETMPAKNVTFHGTPRTNKSTIYYYFESLDQTSPASDTRRLFKGKYFDLRNTVAHNFNFLTYDEEYYEIEGFRRDRSYAEPYFGQSGTHYTNNNQNITNQNRAPIGGHTTGAATEANKNYLYYQRNSYTLEFRNGHNNELISSGSILFENALPVPADPAVTYAPRQNAGYYFSGWYADSACGTRVFFSEEEAEAKKDETLDEYGIYHYTVISGMPSKPLTLYAGWQQQKFPVTINPDGGVLSSTEATYFNANYGELILQYNDVVRPFAEVEPGEDTTGKTIYYYYYDTKALNQATGNTTRMAYYYPASEGVKAQTRLDDNGDPIQYVENPTMYSLVGWYRVVNGKLDLFDFSTGTTEATDLQAVWRKSGVWALRFDAGIGNTIDGNGNSQTFEISNFADGSMIVLDKVAVPNTSGTNLQFIGWTIRGDTTGTVYYPNESLVYRSQFADNSHVMILDAVYSSIVTTSLTFDANGGTGTLTDMASVVKPGSAQIVSGNTVSKIEINDTVTLSSGDGFTRENYRFVGWSTYSGRTAEDFDPDSNATDFDAGTEVVVDNRTANTLYAVWEPTFTVRFEPNGGSGTLTDLVPTSGTAQDVSAANRIRFIRNNETVTVSQGTGFSREGYVFAGWNTAADGSGVSYAPGSTPSVTENLTLYAQWIEHYRVTYDRNGGTGVLAADSGKPALTNNGNGTFSTAKLYRNETVTLNSGEGLSRDGYVFDGWTAAPDGTTVITTVNVAEADVTVYAKWTRLLTVTYRANGGGGTLTNGGSASYGGSTTVLTPVNGVVSDIRSGSALTLSNGEAFSRSGYTLIGWNTDQSAAAAGTVEFAKGASYGTLTDNLTLYAVWQKNLHINYHLNGGTGALSGLVSLGGGEYWTGDIYTVNQNVTLHDGSSISREGYKLIGWSTDPGCTSDTFDASGATDFALGGSMTIAADTDLYAVWAPLLSITYDPNGGEGTLTDGGSYTVAGASPAALTPEQNTVSGIPETSDVTLSNGGGFIRYGYALTGWNTEADGTGTAYALGDTLNDLQADTTLYAQWDRIWSVSFNTQDGTWNSANTGYTEITPGKLYRIGVTDGSTAARPADPIPPAGYVFDHWSASADDSTGPYDFSAHVTGSLTLYAQYAEVTDVAVTFDVNGGTWNNGNPSTYYVPTSGNYVATIPNGSTVNKPIDPEKNDRVFVGWVTQEVLEYLGKQQTVTDWSQTTSGKTGGSTGYVNDLAYIKANLYDFSQPVLEDTTLHAVWSETVRVNYNLLCWVFDGYGIHTTHYHTWTPSDNADYEDDGQNKFCIIAKGDFAPLPNDPTPNTEGYLGGGIGGSQLKNGAYFRSWLWNDNSYRNSTAAPPNTSIYNFSNPVTENNITLYTSWLGDDRNTGIITIKKVYSVDSSQAFDFTATATTADGSSQILNITFSLKNGELRVISLPSGSILTVTENAPGYTARSSVSPSDSPFQFNGNSFTITAPTGYTTSTGGFIPVTVQHPGESTVTVTNIRKTADVTVSKVYAGEEDPEFSFTASATDGGSSYTLPTADASFTLHKGNTHTFEDLPVGVVLTVTESTAGYQVSSVTGATQSGSGFILTVPDGGAAVTVTNVKTGGGETPGSTGNVTVTKTVTDPLNAGESFSFEAAFRDATDQLMANQPIRVNGAAAVTDADGRYAFTLSDSGSVTFNDLPAGAIVTVTENGAADYDTTASGIPGGMNSGKTYIFDVPAGDSTVTFANERRDVTVNVSKRLENGTAADEARSFQFTARVKLNDSTVNYNKNGFAGGQKIFTVTGEGTEELTVPAGATLEITENETAAGYLPARYDVSASGMAGGSLSGAAYTFAVPSAGGTAAFVNTRRTVSVTVTKTLVDPLKTGDESFAYTATLTDGGSPVGDYPIYGASMTSAGGVFSASFGESSPVVLTVPYGASLQVAETAAAGYTTAYSIGGGYTDGSSHTFTDLTANARIDFKNTLGTQTVTVYKTVIDPLGPDRSFTFTGHVTNAGGEALAGWSTVTGALVSTTGDLITDDDGRLTFTLTPGGTGQALILPIGAKLVVTETDADLYTTTVAETDASDQAASGGSASNANKTYTLTVPTADRKLTFTNKMPYYKVTVQKDLIDPVATGSETFAFAVSASDVNGTAYTLPASWSYDDNGTARTSTLTGGVFTLEKSGAAYTEKELWLPVGSSVTITEADAANYDTTVTRQVGSGAVEAVADAAVDYLHADTTFVFTNTRRQIPVTILKVDDQGNNLNGATFTCTQAFPTGTLATDGSSTVFVGTLYAGVTYTLTESVVPTNYAGPAGTVSIRIEDGNITFLGSAEGDVTCTYDDISGQYTVKIRNTRQISLVNVYKALTDPIAVGTERFSFTAVLTEDDGRPVADYPILGSSGTTNSAGEVTFTAAANAADPVTLSVPYGWDLAIREELGEDAACYNTMTSGDGVYDSGTRTVTLANLSAASATVTFSNYRKTTRVFVYKTLEDILSSTDQDFDFTAALYKADGTTPLASYSVDGSDAAGSKTDADGAYTFRLSLKNGETKDAYLVVPVGARVVISEVLTAAEAAIYDSRASLDGAGCGVWTGTRLSTDQFEAKPDQNSIVRFTNTRKTATLTVTKTVTGSMGDRTQKFDFTLSGLVPGVEYTFSAARVSLMEEADAEGRITFKLAHDDFMTIDLPIGPGQNYTVAEAAAPHYTTTVDGASGYSWTVTGFQEDTAVAYVNHLPAIAATGLDLDIKPQTLIFAFGGFMLLTMLAAPMFERMRRRPEDPTWETYEPFAPPVPVEPVPDNPLSNWCTVRVMQRRPLPRKAADDSTWYTVRVMGRRPAHFGGGDRR